MARQPAAGVGHAVRVSIREASACVFLESDADVTMLVLMWNPQHNDFGSCGILLVTILVCPYFILCCDGFYKLIS
ncbi:hypothetical protein BDA96_01G236800 [Sorghum bicolor]|jgi:hypothetical protein|uniref:Uncharacterized protein n=2 Tax=Sorghum bicolor TaxID=4558 RepID=A0A921UYM3_SORBI|nr:hypothetical protein BDA96_01G236800 [Sorghum bicolor]OQU91654.1 hypothetical protein SORBI_3001G222150 [Sorghum bicolor]